MASASRSLSRVAEHLQKSLVAIHNLPGSVPLENADDAGVRKPLKTRVCFFGDTEVLAKRGSSSGVGGFGAGRGPL